MSEFYTLNDGFKFPKMGFGTYKLYGRNGARKIEQALDVGYRLIDSAYNYENEGSVGHAIRNSSVPREQITVTSKLPGRYHEYNQALLTIEESVLRMGLDYIDLYLIHWPNPLEDKYVEAWQALVDAQKMGLIRSIGVSNFLPEHIDRLEKETGILPTVNQIEMHPYYNQKDQIAYTDSKGIVTEAWSPIGRSQSNLLKEPAITKIAEAHGKSPAQVVFRWQAQQGVVPIPKSGNYKRQVENISVFDFELSAEEMKMIDALGRDDGRMNDQDPAKYQEF